MTNKCALYEIKMNQSPNCAYKEVCTCLCVPHVQHCQFNRIIIVVPSYTCIYLTHIHISINMNQYIFIQTLITYYLKKMSTE